MVQYSKAMENSKADQAAAVAQSIANANRSFNLEKGGYLDGDVSACDPAGTASGTCNASVCDLMYCNYLARQDLRCKPYKYLASNGSAGSCATANLGACTRRRPGTDACGVGTDSTPYVGWGYDVSLVGVVTPIGGAPTPP